MLYAEIIADEESVSSNVTEMFRVTFLTFRRRLFQMVGAEHQSKLLYSAQKYKSVQIQSWILAVAIITILRLVPPTPFGAYWETRFLHDWSRLLATLHASTSQSPYHSDPPKMYLAKSSLVIPSFSFHHLVFSSLHCLLGARLADAACARRN